jgi:hypothetical protein
VAGPAVGTPCGLIGLQAASWLADEFAYDDPDDVAAKTLADPVVGWPNAAAPANTSRRHPKHCANRH